VLGVYVADFVRDDGEHYFFCETFVDRRGEYDDKLFDADGEGVVAPCVLSSQAGAVDKLAVRPFV
jgi:hypothetical protein